MQFSALQNFVNLQEAERIPLAGHPYHDKSDAELRHIMKDASEAARAMKGHDEKAESKYLDQVNDASTILYYRKKKKLNESKDSPQYALYVGERGSGALHIQHTCDTAAECKQEFKDSWGNQYDSNNKKIKYSHRIVKINPGDDVPRKLDESIEDEVEHDLDLLESMTDEQKAKREQIVLAMKKKTAEFKERYGKDWKSVMYATATKEAMNEAEDEVYVVALAGDGGKIYNFDGPADENNLESATKYNRVQAKDRAYRLNDYLPGAAVWVAIPLSVAMTRVTEAKEDKDEESEELKDACWDGYEAIGTKKKNGKTVPNCVPVSEDHGKGFYVMVGDEEHCWCETREEANEKVEALKEKGKTARIVADKDVKGSIEHEEVSDKSKATEKKGSKGSKEKAEDKSCEVKESTNNNFIQPVDDDKNPLNARMGVDMEREAKIEIPADVKKAATQRIAELKKSIEYYDNKGYNDHSQKQKAIDCIEQIMDNLSTGDVEGLKKAQIFVTTLMSPITDLMPANLFTWLANAQNK